MQIVICGRDSDFVFTAPGDATEARELWLFLVENLQGGFTVRLEGEGDQLTLPDGTTVPGLAMISDIVLPENLYRFYMGQPRPEPYAMPTGTAGAMAGPRSRPESERQFDVLTPHY